MDKIHNIHESYGDHYNRNKLKNLNLLMTIGIICILGSIGGFMQKKLDWGFGLLIIGVLLTFFSYKSSRRVIKRIGKGTRISFG